MIDYKRDYFFKKKHRRILEECAMEILIEKRHERTDWWKEDTIEALNNVINNITHIRNLVVKEYK